MKKGGVPFTVVSIILILIAFGVLAIFLAQLTGIGKDLSKREICREQFLITAGLKVGGTKTFGAVLDSCKTQLRVVDSDVKEEILEDISEEIYWCWWYSKNVDPTPDWNWFGSKNYCVPCAVIEFEGDAKTFGSISVEDLIDHMKENSLADKDITGRNLSKYYEYINDNSYEERPREEDISGGNLIDLNQPLDIYWVMSKSGITLTEPVFDLIKEGNSYYYDRGLLFSLGNVFVDKPFTIDPRQADEDYAKTILGFQEPIDELNPNVFCNAKV